MTDIYFYYCYFVFEVPELMCVGVSCESNPCLNGGTCVNYTTGVVCLCAHEYVGMFCAGNLPILVTLLFFLIQF